ncbi:formate dehydrogenase subunit gamma [Pseudomonas luteola]|uniref:formate dehydrogenase subunit gamma n=1 Tax=Pseudomonas luteola TaxID=47886 RepID=UPI001EF4D3A9|nr:formate dehydrogenase subunit gamma [Pseudomonas luteola]MCG7371793.1 formate dehydrogenase subunit gamma [Pseudomonas luteola]
MTPSSSEKGILRYSTFSRLNHWVIAITFVCLVLSGLAFFHPFFFDLTALFGGPIVTRMVHPFIGVIMALCFVVMAIRFFKVNLFKRHDIEWMKHIGDVLSNRDELAPPIGINNPGQKLVYWLMVMSVPLLLISGIVIWRPYFAEYFPREWLRVSSLVHAYVAFVAIITLIIHVYSAIWVKGSFRAMTQGRVSRAWAKHHHRLWYDDIVEQERKEKERTGSRSGAVNEHHMPTKGTP